MTPGDAENADNVVTCTIYSLSYNVVVLFYSGATHFFISREFVKQCGVEAQPLEVELGVDTPSGLVVVCSRVVKDYLIEIQGRRLLANLIVFDMHGFDVILEMDSLESSFMRQLLLGGCQGYLASVKESPKEGLKLEDISVIKEFSDVFLEDLLGLLPDREVDFAIKLAPRTAPISKALYRMASAELKELKEQFLPLLDLFNEVEFQRTCGQMIDLITMLEGEKDLSKYSLPIHRRIVQYKTAYYSFYLPVACALLMFGENLDDHVEVKNILVEMGIYFQVQDDYMDCFGDPEVIGKIGIDIEDFKCSWLVVKALERCNEEQKKLLRENYGKANQANVAKVKELYKELDIEGAFLEYESSSYKKLTSAIEAQPSKAVEVVLKSFLGKIYKR
ncbi:farnesyl pyrophosphate synthase 2-like [Malania oleifera]|uniref:farnesyl pyrophosphate synthase 2-like n=1 Tax=Malania oleifera TaxID=397392 RepID=UPI0025AE63FE|nr:farnesyl pyrophosphate synthase 2-like [Malania oleifera]